MTKLEKIGEDLERAKKKRAEWDQRVKELENRYREEENTVIHGMVHAANLTPEQLAQILRQAAAGAVGIYPENMKNEEDSDNEY